MTNNIAKIAVLASALAMTSCTFPSTETRTTHQRYPVDQVFQDHDGYRIVYTNSAKMVKDKKFYRRYGEQYCGGNPIRFPADLPTNALDSLPSFKTMPDEPAGIRIFKDLPDSIRGYANVLNYGFGVNEYNYDTIVEMHIPQSCRINPGIEVYGGKHKTVDLMQEIR